jgi:DNA-binding CsgD family transcriptional regulator
MARGNEDRCKRSNPTPPPTDGRIGVVSRVAGAVLLERGDSLAAVDAVLGALRDGGGGVLLLEGQAGIGKTVLLDEAERRARGVEVLRASGGEFERDLPLGVVRQLLEPRVRRGDRSRIPSADPASVRIELYWMAVAMAEEEPLLLLVDDLHWADRESLEWLLFTVRRLEGTRIALIAAMRPAEPGAAQELLARLAAQPGVVIQRPAALSIGATGSLVRAWSGGDSVASEFEAACHRLSGGNPFLLSELLSEASRAGVTSDPAGAERLDRLVPEGLARAVLLRLRPLGPEARALARSVAVMGIAVELRHAAALAELSLDDATAAADALVRVGVLRDCDPLELAHPLLRAAVLSELTAAALGALHARAARLLAGDGAEPDRVGAHLLAAPASKDPWVVDRLLEAAAHARERGAPESAALLMERALAEPPTDERRVDVEAALGSALSTAGDARGIEHVQAARELTADPVARAQLTLRHGTPFFLLGRGAEMADLIRRTLEELGARAPSLAFTLRAGLATGPVSGAPFDPRGLIAELLEQPPDPDTLDPIGRVGLASLAIGACVVAAPATAVAATARQALGDLEQHRTAIANGFPLLQAITALGFAEGSDQLGERLAMVEEGVRKRGALALGLAMLRCTQAQLALHAGDLPSAQEQARAATAITAETSFPLLHAQSLALLAAALRKSGEAEEADVALRALPPPERSGAWAAAARSEFAALALDHGNYAAALRESTAAGEIADPIGAVNPVVFGSWRSSAALALRATGKGAEAARVAQENAAHARGFGAPGAIGGAMRIEGLVHDDLDLLAEAERVLAPSVARLEHAIALVDLGSALRRRGQRVKAREPLSAGMELAHGCGAEPLVERARTELQAAGARPRRVVRTGVESLTPSERRVAELAADGRTNREIAQELFVTKSTVETHLRSVFRKLDIQTRTELAKRLTASSS